MKHEHFSPAFPTPWLGACLLAAACLWTSPALAFSQYSTDRNRGNCADCHGEFLSSPYTSMGDMMDWPDGLHTTHQGMVDFDCNTCHTTGGRFPVQLGSSNGGDGLDPISCVGCHGRAEDGSGSGSSRFGAGLRQHHWRAGVQCTPCHAESDPASFTPVGEDVLPPYYADPGNGHPNIPDDPCNPGPGFPEGGFGGSTLGLDNDGDDDGSRMLYDQGDPDCMPPGGVCGDGNLDPGEQCDDGNTLDGDCCSSMCTFEPSGSACDDGTFCTVGTTCDGMGSCGGGMARDCDDGDICTTDTCNDAMQRCDNIFDPNNDPSCQTCVDADTDTFSPIGGTCGPVDCDDSDPRINPGEAEVCDDDLDNDCDTHIDAADSDCGFDGAPAVRRGPLDDPDYAGSDTCGGCHPSQFESWRNTLHARVQIRTGDAQAAGFSLPPFNPGLGTDIQSWNDVLFVVGQKWRTAYVDRQGRVQGQHWTYAQAGWSPANQGNQVDYDCGACHSTGYDPAATFEQPAGNPVPGVVGSWVEYSIGCEACHGPGAAHASSPSSENINQLSFDWYDPDLDGVPDAVKIGSATVCGNCHYRNDRQGLQSDRLNREQYNDWLASAHSSSLQPTAVNTYCAQCHSPGNALADSREHFFTNFEPSEATHAACISCHNPHSTSNERFATLEFPQGGRQDPKSLQARIARYRGTDGNIGTDDYVPFANDQSSQLCSDCHKLQPGFRRHSDASPEVIVTLMPPFNSGEPFEVPHREHVEEGNAQCVDCHMHYTRQSANPDDVRSHSMIPDELSVVGSTAPHYSTTCAPCHPQAPDCTWCHGDFGGQRLKRQLVGSHGELRERRIKPRVSPRRRLDRSSNR